MPAEAQDRLCGLTHSARNEALQMFKPVSRSWTHRSLCLQVRSSGKAIYAVKYRRGPHAFCVSTVTVVLIAPCLALMHALADRGSQEGAGGTPAATDTRLPSQARGCPPGPGPASGAMRRRQHASRAGTCSHQAAGTSPRRWSTSWFGGCKRPGRHRMRCGTGARYTGRRGQGRDWAIPGGPGALWPGRRRGGRGSWRGRRGRGCRAARPAAVTATLQDLSAPGVSSACRAQTCPLHHAALECTAACACRAAHACIRFVWGG